MRVGQEGIRVNVVLPLALSPSMDGFLDEHPEARDGVLGAIPLGFIGDSEQRHRPRGGVALLRRRQLRHRHQHLRRRWPGLRPLATRSQGDLGTCAQPCTTAPVTSGSRTCPSPTRTRCTVKVRSLHNGLCGTDLHQYFVGPMSPAPLPTVVGHEFSGEVVELGAGVTSVALGDLVAIEPLWPCGTCAPCTAGDPNLCSEVLCHGLGGPGRRALGVHRRARAHGAQAPRGSRPGARRPGRADVGRLPGGAPRPSHARRDAAVVFGGGPIGIGAFLALRALGVDDVTVVEPAAERRAAVAALGAETVLDPTATDVVDDVREHDGRCRRRASWSTPPGVPASFTAASRRRRAAADDVVTVAAYMEPVSLQPDRCDDARDRDRVLVLLQRASSTR